jgi:uncharacterized RmlC-like cupin family protein
MGKSDLRPVLTPAGQLDPNTAQSGDCVRLSGVSSTTSPASKIWFGKVSNGPGFRSPPHHHAEAESAGYVVKGHGRVYWGEKFEEYLDIHEGDFVFIPANFVHVEANMSPTDELHWMTCRSPDNIVVNLPEIEDALLADFSRPK